jgi:ribonuclease HI/ADP-ribose pyrophosphatase YjhB (NUDIX family)
MKQRVVVQGILKNNDEVLLLKRSQGRPSLIGKYELPGGTINSSEQPEDALCRHVLNNTGLRLDRRGLKLKDVMSITSRDDGDIQHIFVVYAYEGSVNKGDVKLGNSYNDSAFLNVDKARSKDLRDSASLILGITKNQESTNSSGDVKNTTKSNNTVIYSDGGSRGNPGPSAAAFVIVDTSSSIIDQGGEYIGITTSNQAEYQGVLLGLEQASALGIRGEIDFRIDSMLVVNQLRGFYSIKNRDLWPINERIKALLVNFSGVRFSHIPREMNSVADALVNKILDEHID